MPDIDDPFRPDATLLRPRPGAGRRGVGDTAHVRVPPASVSEGEPISSAAREMLGAGLNPLVRAASPILILAGRLRGSLTPMDVAGLRQHALDEIRRFDEQARSAGVANEVALAARYALCAGLDEAVMSTPWGAQSEWSQHPLLVTLHREAWGGEKFFEMLDRIGQDPTRYIDLMELQYLLLAFGFAGKYHVRDRGHEELARIQQELYHKIRSQRGTTDTELSLRWEGIQDRRNRLTRYVPWWVVAGASLALVALAFVGYQTRLASVAAPVKLELSRVGYEVSPAPGPPAPAPGPTLKQLLAPQEAAGALSVAESGRRSVVTLLGGDLFSSGSATINEAYLATLQQVAEALNRVAGPVQIVGHTDDQNVRSLRYQDNFDLSRARALSVEEILGHTVTNRARLSSRGVGSSEPLYRPESDPDNRARNRRVEVIHVRGS